MSLRRSPVSKVIALWFVVLIVLPFTAPFQAWDPRTPIGKAAGHDVKTSEKLSTDVAIAARAPAAASSATFIIVCARIPTAQVTRHSVLQTVLRL